MVKTFRVGPATGRDRQQPFLPAPHLAPQQENSTATNTTTHTERHAPSGGGTNVHHPMGVQHGLVKTYCVGPAIRRDRQQPFLHAPHVAPKQANSPRNQHVSETTVRGTAGQPRAIAQRRPNRHTQTLERNTKRGLRSTYAIARRQVNRTAKRRESRRNNRQTKHNNADKELGTHDTKHTMQQALKARNLREHHQECHMREQPI